MQSRYDDFQAAIADLTLTEVQHAGASVFLTWLEQWAAYIQNGNLQHPPHKPPF